jgi:hypothetical protein
VWQDEHDYDGNIRIFYRRSTNSGKKWDTTVLLEDSPQAASYPCIAASGDTVHVVWQDTRDTNPEIYYKRSINNGETWEPNIRITYDYGNSLYPSLALSKNTVHLFWGDNRDELTNSNIYYTRSTDGGSTWKECQRLRYDTTEAYYPVAATSGDTIHLVWNDRRNENKEEIYYKRSIDGGNTWQGDKRLTFSKGISACPSIAVLRNDVHVVWFNEVEPNEDSSDICYMHSPDAGATWETEQMISKNSPSYYPSIASSESGIHTIWTTFILYGSKVLYCHGGSVQPDNLIKKIADDEYTGDNIYNNNGNGQTATQSLDKHDTAIYYIKIENDGQLTDSFTVTGYSNIRYWDIKYFDSPIGGNDITQLVTHKKWSTGLLKHDEYKEIRLEVTPGDSVPDSSSLSLSITSTSISENSQKDVVIAKTITPAGIGEPHQKLLGNFKLELDALGTHEFKVNYSLPRDCQVSIVIYNASGRKIKTLVSEIKQAGQYTAEWLVDKSLPQGVYFCNLKTTQAFISRRIVLLR